jgi:beta-glucosidase
MKHRQNSGFPRHFLWGAATASHQVEGGNHNQWTVWELENANAKAAQAEYQLHDYPTWDEVKSEAKKADNYVSGNLGDHYHRYKEDFEYLEKMNMNAYRFSIEWSRVEPEEGAWNTEAIAHYKEYLSELHRRNIEPVVTLLHFTLPVWFAEKGGFEKRSNVAYFVRYADKIMIELGNSVRFIITINEPEVYGFESYYLQNWPPNKASLYKMWRVSVNQATAHRKVAKTLHEINRRYKVGIAKNTTYFFAGDNAWLSQLSANIFQYFQDDYFIKKYIRHCDFLGVNYYQSQRVFGYRIFNSEKADYSDVDWMLAPSDIEYALERLGSKYKKPLMITENGLADAEDEYRQWWIKETIIGMQKALKNNVDLIGYFHWSLLDNFEWAYGKWPRFGLVAIDYKTGKRTLRPSAVWFGRVLKKLRS